MLKKIIDFLVPNDRHTWVKVSDNVEYNGRWIRLTEEARADFIPRLKEKQKKILESLEEGGYYIEIPIKEYNRLKALEDVTKNP